jgi:hypothetical protein
MSAPTSPQIRITTGRCRGPILVPAQAYVGKFLKTFEQFPPRQKPASFSVGGQMEELEKALSRLNGDID